MLGAFKIGTLPIMVRDSKKGMETKFGYYCRLWIIASVFMPTFNWFFIADRWINAENAGSWNFQHILYAGVLFYLMGTIPPENFLW